MKEQDKIPTSKVARATKFLKAGAKVGGNYLKHYSQKLIGDEVNDDDLHKKNAAELYDALSQLKGSALKVAQMLSMNEALPEAYNEQFAMAQFKAPPLSLPLIVNTFRKSFGKSPFEIFNEFSKVAVNAASIGQVHSALQNGNKLAVKIQYPGIADSIKSDLAIVKPFAMRLFNLNKDEVEYYMSEVETKLIEETDYTLELKNAQMLTQECKHLPHLVFPEYYPEFSNKSILTMGWLEGIPLKEYLKTNPSQETRNKLGQSLWDFYTYQIHVLHKMHADPHPGNFVVTPDEQLGILDFGCVSVISESFYHMYFKLIEFDYNNLGQEYIDLLKGMNMILPTDTPEVQELVIGMMTKVVSKVILPFQHETFDFGDDSFFDSLIAQGREFGEDKSIRKINSARGLREAIYVNRTHIGLFMILHEIRANINTSISARLRYLKSLN